jgi:uncharacterized membrane protein YfcA
VIVVAGLLCAIVGLSLGGLGGGGCVLELPRLVYVAGLPVSEAVTMSSMIVGVSSAAACVFHARRGNVDLKTALLFGGAGIPGALLGAHLSAEVSRQVLLGSFAVLLLGVSVWMGFGRVPENRDAKPWPVLAVIGAGVGVIAGLFGVGGGFMIVPALTGIAGLPMRRAIGTSLVVIAMNSVASMFEHTIHATLPSLTAALFTSAAVVGALVGQRIAMRCSVCHLRRGFALLILVVSGLVAWRVLDAL